MVTVKLISWCVMSLYRHCRWWKRGQTCKTQTQPLTSLKGEVFPGCPLPLHTFHHLYLFMLLSLSGLFLALVGAGGMKAAPKQGHGPSEQCPVHVAPQCGSSACPLPARHGPLVPARAALPGSELLLSDTVGDETPWLPWREELNGC